MVNINGETKNIYYRDVFKNRNYIYLWSGQLISQLGDAISLIALPLLIFKLTESAISLTIAFILEAIPWILIGPLVGVFIDKINKKYVVIATDFIRFFLILCLFFTENLIIIYTICFLTQAFAAIFAPARSALIPEIVEKNLYVKAIGLSHVGFQIVQVIGPLIAASLIGLIGLHTAFIIDSATFSISVICSMFIQYTFEKNKKIDKKDKQKRTFFFDFKKGVAELIKNKVLKYVTAINLLKGLVSSFTTVGALLYVKNSLVLNSQDSDPVYGLVMAMFSIGLILGTWLIGYYEKQLDRRYLINVGLILQGLFLLMIFFEPNFIFTCIIFFFAGLTSSGAMTPVSAYYAEHTTNTIRGRVYSATNASIKLVSIIGYFIAGLIGEYIGSTSLFLLTGMLLIILTSVTTVSLKGFTILAPQNPEKKTAVQKKNI
ncbi:MFS transporter [Lysinibacillus sp. NPDC092081]|uniref:MFS transporter n=1 Tax=Lysinibacillus sp. NPDC092081 TaxID=3364131 RepID=UPI00380EB09A